MTKKTEAPTDRVRLRRNHERAGYDADAIYPILDAMPMCSVGYVFNGHPYVTSTLHWRDGDHIYWHGSSASQMLRATQEADVCINVSIIDGFVMARSGFNHSTNYRSVMMFGKARKVTDPDEKEASLKTFVDGLFPGRWDTLRAPDTQEMKATTVLTMPISEASAKARKGPPVDEKDDYNLPVWGGVIPVKFQFMEPESDGRNLDGVSIPDHVRDFKFG